MPFFSSKKKKDKINLKEFSGDKRRMGKSVDPTRAITEDEPWAIAQSAAKGISQLKHKDQYGNEITDPDRSNPTRHRMERPLDTIRSFERAIYNDERELYPRRSHRHESQYGNQPTHRASMQAYQYGEPNNRQSNYDNYDNASIYSQQAPRSNYPQRQSTYENYGTNSSSRMNKPEYTSDANSGSYAGNSGWSNDPYSTNPSSDASMFREEPPVQYGSQPGKPLPSIARQSSGGPQGYSQSPNQQYGGYGAQQQPGGYSGNSQFAPQNTQNGYGQRQSYQNQPSAWASQPAAQPRVLAKNSASAASGKGEKRKSWFRRSKS